MKKNSKSAQEKCQIKGTVRQAVQELMQTLHPLRSHVF